MKTYTEFSQATGEVLSYIESEFDPDGEGSIFEEGHFEHAEWWRDGTGTRVPRPHIVDVVDYSVSVGSTIEIELPEGTIIGFPARGPNRHGIVRDYEQKVELEGDVLSLTLEEPRTFSISILPHFPYRPATITIEVTP